MQGSTFGNIFCLHTFGESHGDALGVVIEGVPAGLEVNEKYINEYLKKRRPGTLKYSTKRNESDTAKIYSGVFEGKSTGTPIMIMIENEDQRSSDYSNIKDVYRPGHADYTYQMKYGIRDYRGGGRSSARETIGRVCAGAIAKYALERLGVSFITYTEAVGDVTCNDINLDEINNELYMPDKNAYESALKILDKASKDGDSVGGVCKCIVKNIPTGLGEPVFKKLDADISGGIFSIGAVKAVEIGAGVNSAKLVGSINNDEFYLNESRISKKTNNSGGILGGLSDGSDIEIRVHFKPTPSISKTQNTVKTDGSECSINIHGRHDAIIVPRALVVVESMVAITLFDQLLMNMSSKMENIYKLYEV